MAPRIVCVAGMPGCGKEEFLRVAAERGLAVVRMGDVVRETAEERGLPPADEAVGGLAHAEREAHGYGIWAERTVPRVGEEPTVVDGVRGPDELAVFRKAFGDDLVVVAIHASPRTRHARIRRRGREDDHLGWEAFRRRDEREMRWGLAEVIATADHLLVNEGDLPAFRREADALLERIVQDG